MKTRHFLFLSFSLAIGSLLYGAEEEEKISVQFVAFPKDADPQPMELYLQEGQTLPVELPTNSISPVYKVGKPEKWVIGSTNVGADGTPSFKEYGQAPVLESNHQLVLVIRDGETDELTLFPFDSGDSGFGGGKYLFVNLSKTEISGEIGASQFDLKSLGQKLLAPEGVEVKGDRNYLHTKFYFSKGEDKAQFYSSTWRFSEKARSLVFFFDDPSNDRIRTHTIRDYPR